MRRGSLSAKPKVSENLIEPLNFDIWSIVKGLRHVHLPFGLGFRCLGRASIRSGVCLLCVPCLRLASHVEHTLGNRYELPAALRKAD